MQPSVYESVRFPDLEFPIIFHQDYLPQSRPFAMHWQDSLEMLYFVEGRAEVTSDTLRCVAEPGDLVLINCNHLHSIHSKTPSCRYYCCIVDREFCEQSGISIGQLNFQMLVADTTAREFFDMVVDEMLTRRTYYKAAVKANIAGLLVHFCRHYLESEDLSNGRTDKRLEMIKTAIRYIRENFAENLSIEQIAAATGFSKYYFCRGFKEITGRTVVDYLNFTRCSHARRLLSSGKFNVSESAESSGFSNLSYFTKTYKKYMGMLPSQTEKQKRNHDLLPEEND